MDDTTIHIKIKKTVASNLKELANRRGVSVGELVRQAISSVYSLDFSTLSPEKRRALAAYMGGFISMEKLAEIMGFHAIEMRMWLRDHAIEENAHFDPKDTEHAL